MESCENSHTPEENGHGLAKNGHGLTKNGHGLAKNGHGLTKNGASPNNGASTDHSRNKSCPMFTIDSQPSIVDVDTEESSRKVCE